jgi:hypothetical protein
LCSLSFCSLGPRVAAGTAGLAVNNSASGAAASCILALASAAATNLAFLFKHRGAVLALPIRVRHRLRSAAGLFRSRWFLVG